jgi:Preprotein translocase subunit SecB
MEKKYTVLAKFVKDMSVETKDTQTYLFVKENIKNYHLKISINSKALKNKMIEIDTGLNFEDKQGNEFRTNFEMTYTSVIKLNEVNIEKEQLEKIILIEVQNEIYPDLEKSFLDMVHNAGYDNFTIDKKINFETLYENRTN